jgi:hypothetical protein
VKGGAGRGARGIILRCLLTGGFEFGVCGVVNLIDIDREMHSWLLPALERNRKRAFDHDDSRTGRDKDEDAYEVILARGGGMSLS